MPKNPHTTPHPTLAGRSVTGRLLPGPAPTIAQITGAKPSAAPTKPMAAPGGSLGIPTRQPAPKPPHKPKAK